MNSDVKSNKKNRKNFCIYFKLKPKLNGLLLERVLSSIN
jgi:hypothetical protein